MEPRRSLSLLRFEGALRCSLVRRRLGDLRRVAPLAAALRRLPGPLRSLPLRVPRLWWIRYPVTDMRVVRDTRPFIGEGFGRARVRFGHPYGVAAGRGGRFVVADTFKNRVLLFDSEGRVRHRIHHAREGRLHLNMPMSVALDRQERVVVLNSGVGALHLYDSRGRYLRDILAPGAGRLVGARGLALAGDRRILVCDTRRHRLLALDERGEVLEQLADSDLCRWGYAYPMAVTVSPSGRIAVCDTLHHSVALFDSHGRHQRTIGGLGADMGRFNAPAACAFGPDESLLVLEWAGNRLQIFTPEGEFQACWGRSGSWLLGQRLGELSWAGGMAIDAERGQVLIADTHNHRVQRVPLQTLGKLRSMSPPPAPRPPHTERPAQSKVSPAPALPRVRFIETPPIERRLKSPQGLTRIDEDQVWIADTFHNRVVRWDTRGTRSAPLGRLGKRPGEFINPTDAARVRDRMLVVDSLNSRIQRFTLSGTPAGMLEIPDLELPRSIAHCAEVGLAVAEQLRGRVRVFDAAGRLLWSTERAQGMVDQPAWIRWHRGELYVADAGRMSIVVFSAAGECLRSWGRLGAGPGDLNHPYALTIVADRWCAVADAGNHRIQFYTTGGRWLQEWRGDSEQSRLFYPRGLLWHAGRRRLLVADSERHRLVELEIEAQPHGAREDERQRGRAAASIEPAH